MSEIKYPVCEPLLGGRELEYITEAVASGWISSSGKYVGEFEKAFSKYCCVDFGVAVCNGTVALHLALLALGIGPGDEVILPNFTMISSAFAICYTGAMPIFVDAEKRTWNMDPEKIQDKITKKTKVIMPVHIFGLPCDMDPIRTIAKENNLYVLEDAAEAHGALYGSEKAGSMSDIAAFSFFSNKNITCGEGGMIVTRSRHLYDRSRYLKNIAFPLDAPRTYMHEDVGFNYRMSNLHAAIGLAQTEKADDYKKMRIANGRLYRKYLKDVPGIYFQEDIAPLSGKTIENVYWMNGIMIDESSFGRNRDEVMRKLAEKGIDTRLVFVGMNRQNGLRKYGCTCLDKGFPVTDYLSSAGMYLPSGSGLQENDIAFISDTLMNLRK